MIIIKWYRFIYYFKANFKFLLIIFTFFILIKDFSSDIFIEKELSEIEPNSTELNWNNIYKDFTSLALKYEYLLSEEKNIPEDSPIWLMWYQGIEKAPRIVQSCVKSIIENRGNHKVFIINKFNINNYIKLPSYIYEKLNNGSFSITHFSDIIRFGLLYKYGGYWIDSTLFITSPLENINSTFFTLKKNNTVNHPFMNRRWAGFFLGTTKKSFISTYCYIGFLIYWKKYNSLIHYFLIDYVIYIAYKSVNQFKYEIEKLPDDKCHIWLLNYLNSNYNKKYFKCHYFKLSYKTPLTSLNGTKKTNYGYIIKKYKLNFEKLNKNSDIFF